MNLNYDMNSSFVVHEQIVDLLETCLGGKKHGWMVVFHVEFVFATSCRPCYFL